VLERIADIALLASVGIIAYDIGQNDREAFKRSDGDFVFLPPEASSIGTRAKRSQDTEGDEHGNPYGPVLGIIWIWYLAPAKDSANSACRTKGDVGRHALPNALASPPRHPISKTRSRREAMESKP
jgi:hypothetical protein